MNINVIFLLIIINFFLFEQVSMRSRLYFSIIFLILHREARNTNVISTVIQYSVDHTIYIMLTKLSDFNIFLA